MMGVVDPFAGSILLLQRTRPWVRLAGVIAFLLSAVMAFLGLQGAVGGLMARRLDRGLFIALDFLFAAGFLMLGVYLHQYASRITVFAAQGHNVQLEAALEAQRKFWKVAGLCALLALILLALAGSLTL
jgi:hypothetical protein